MRRGLSEDGAAVDVARSGEDALWMAAAAPYDAVVLDVMLPGIDGFETCRRLRDDGVWTPVLLLTARDAVEDRVAGLDGGRRRLPRQAVLVRRAVGAAAGARAPRPAGAPGGARGRRPAARPGHPAGLARRGGDRAVRQGVRAARGLHAPARARCSRRLDLLEHAWDFGYENRSNVIDVYVRYLREKVDRPVRRESIETVRGAGYRLREDGGRRAEPRARSGSA